MRHGSVWSESVNGAVAVLAIACCMAIGVTFNSAARVSAATRAVALRALQVRTAEIRESLLSSVKLAPAPNANTVAPDQPVVVTLATGRLDSVRVTSTAGVVAGALAPSARAWRSRGLLAYGTEYHVTAAMTGELDTHAVSTMTFQTLTPAAGVSASAFPSNGLTVGVGQPIVLMFDASIPDSARAGVVSHLSVTESQPVVGGWHWFSDRELHFRPRTFWPKDEQVNVAWDLTGWNAGNGAWGTGQGATSFTVGDAHVSFANLETHQMTVTDNGVTIATFPISGGKPTDPTMGGVHLVMDRATVVHMVSSTNGVPVNSPDGYDELVYDDVHISDSGEYVHAAPWSVSSQGRSNVSHGCINLSPADASAFYGFSRIGDVVIVAGSPRPPAAGDHGVMDWSADWSAFHGGPSAG